MPRIARVVGVDYPHHIVHRGNNKQNVFFDDVDRQLYISLLKKYAAECSCKILAYCLMVNHVHILLIPRFRDSLAKTMQKLSLTFTQYINKRYQRSGRLWECRFYSCLVDTDAYLWKVCRYIERNPVRAGLVKDPREYRWSSAEVNTGLDYQQDDCIEPIWEHYISRENYTKFLCQKDSDTEIEAIRKATRNGFPLGKEHFIKQMCQRFDIIMNSRPRGRPFQNK